MCSVIFNICFLFVILIILIYNLIIINKHHTIKSWSNGEAIYNNELTIIDKQIGFIYNKVDIYTLGIIYNNTTNKPVLLHVTFPLLHTINIKTEKSINKFIHNFKEKNMKLKINIHTNTSIYNKATKNTDITTSYIITFIIISFIFIICSFFKLYIKKNEYIAL